MVRNQRQGKSSKAPLADCPEPVRPLSPEVSTSVPSSSSSGWFSKPSKWFGSTPNASSSTSGTGKEKEVLRKRSLDIKRTLGAGSETGRAPMPERSITPQPSTSQMATPSSSSKFFMRRPTFSHPTTPHQSKASHPPVPPLPTATTPSSTSHRGHPTHFVPLTDDSFDITASGNTLASASRKPWSRSVDDLSKLLGKASGGGSDGISAGGGHSGFWGQRLPGRGKGGSELPQSTSFPPTESVAYPAGAIKPDSVPKPANRPRRKTNSLAGHALLSSASAAQQASGAPPRDGRPDWAKEYDGVMRSKMSSPPGLGGGTLKSSESSPVLNLAAGSPPTNFTSSAGWRSVSQETKGNSNSSGKATDKHYRSHSHSLLGLGVGNNANPSMLKEEATVAAHIMAASPPSTSAPLHVESDRSPTVEINVYSTWQTPKVSGRQSPSSTSPSAMTGNPAISSPILTPSQADRFERQGLAVSPTHRSGSTPPSPLPSPGLYAPGGSSSLSTSVNSFATPNTVPQALPSSANSSASFPIHSPSNVALSPLTAYDTGRSAKRASQIVTRSGFLLKHPLPANAIRSAVNSPNPGTGHFKPSPSPGHRQAQDYFDTPVGGGGHSPHPKSLDLTKGWKPYKVVIKGSKLCFFKPPSDRRAAIEALFPTALVAEPIPSPKASPPHKAQMGNQGRRRAYWGTARHPELLLHATPLDLDDPLQSRVKAGSLEAYAHELIFFTCFDLPEEPSEELLERMTTSHSAFVDTVLFAHKKMATTTKFLAEVLRCVQMAKNAASPVDPAILRSRALCIVARCVDFYWDDIQAGGQECRGALLEIIEIADENVVKEEDIQDILQRLRDVAEMTSSSSSQPISSAYMRNPSSIGAEGYKSTRVKGGLSAEVLSKFDSDGIAKTLHAFHHDSFRSTNPPLRPKDFTQAARSPAHETHALSLFAFTSAHPHFLTGVILRHIFTAGQSEAPLRASVPLAVSKSASSPSRSPRFSSATSPAPSSSPAPSPAHHRAMILEKWIAVGEASRRSGDAVAFAAVALALCSRPVARLSQAWRRVKDQDRVLLRDVWAPQLSAIGFEDWDAAVIKPLTLSSDGSDTSFVSTIPYLGSVLDDIRRFESNDAVVPEDTTGDSFAFAPMFSAAIPIHRAMDAIKAVAGSDNPMTGVVPDLAAFFQYELELPLPKLSCNSQYQKCSLECEPPLLGNFAETYWKRKPQGHTTSATLLPLLWPEPLPTISLVDREALLNASKEAISRNISSNNLSTTAHHPSTVKSNAPIMGISASGGRRLVRTRSLPSVRYSISEGLPSTTFDDAQRLRKAFFVSMRDVDCLGETLIQVADGELILKATQVHKSGVRGNQSRPSSLIESRPVSRQPSLREGTTMLSNKRNSVPLSISGGVGSFRSRAPSSVRNSFFLIDSLEPLRVVVKSGSLDRLIDVLVSGLDGLSANIDDNGMSGQNRRRFTADLEEYRSVFFATYRSFCRPLALFECLRKRYDRAIYADRRALEDLSTEGSAWLMQTSLPSGGVQWDVVRTLQLGVLSAIEHWITEGHLAQDALDDPELHKKMLAFVGGSSPQALHLDVTSDESSRMLLAEIAPEVRRIRVLLNQELLRPRVDTGMSLTRMTPAYPSLPSRTQEKLHAEFEVDDISASDLLDTLDNVAVTICNKVTEMDLLAAVEIIESQSADKLGWYSANTPSSLDDEVVIQDIYSHLSGTLGSAATERSDSSIPFVRKLPASLRTIFRAHSSMRRWFVLQIAGPGLGLPKRVARLKLFVEVLEICRARASVVDTVWTTDKPSPGRELDPAMSTFVGKAIVAALLSPESRAHGKAWQTVAQDRNCSTDALSTLLDPQGAPLSEVKGQECAIDMGWFLERIIEIVCQVSDFVQDSQHLVNFDKRRYLFNLVGNIPALANHSHSVTPETERFGVQTLTFMEKSLGAFPQDLRIIREDAYRESLQPTSTGKHAVLANRFPRPFQRLVYQQQDKNRRDKAMRDRLLKEQRLENQRIEKREKDLNLLMKPSKSSRGGGSRVTAVFKSLYVRPMSIVTGASPVARGELSPGRTAAQLDFEPTSKPSLVLSLVGATAAPLGSQQRSYTFSVLCDDGAAPMVIQAATNSDALLWIAAINRVGESAAAKRSTFLAAASLPDLLEHDHSKAPLGARAVFGVPLKELIRRDYGNDAQELAVPLVAEKCMAEIERRGLSEIGLYRIPGSVSSINSLRDAFNRGAPIDLSEDGYYADIHVVCGAFKLWIRQLPEPVFPTALYEGLIAAAQIEAYEARLYAIRELVWSLPKPHFALLRRLVEHLDKVTDYEEHNQMPPSSLAIVFAPNLLKPPVENGGFATSMTNLGHAAKLVKAVLLSYHWLFYDEVEVDADGHLSATATPTTSDLTGLGIESDVEPEIAPRAGHEPAQAI